MFSKRLLAVFVLTVVLFSLSSCGSDDNQTSGELGKLPEGARKALDERIDSAGGPKYSVVKAEKSSNGRSWCVVFNAPIREQIGGSTYVYEYAAVDQLESDSDKWNAMLVEDREGGGVLDIMDCKAIYKGVD
jgi:hypothetical protein